jgi:hypothetical protein
MHFLYDNRVCNMERSTGGSNICMLLIINHNISDSQKVACYIHVIYITKQPHLSNYNKFNLKRSTYYITETVKINTYTTEFACAISTIPSSQKKYFI